PDELAAAEADLEDGDRQLRDARGGAELCRDVRHRRDVRVIGERTAGGEHAEHEDEAESAQRCRPGPVPEWLDAPHAAASSGARADRGRTSGPRIAIALATVTAVTRRMPMMTPSEPSTP